LRSSDGRTRGGGRPDRGAASLRGGGRSPAGGGGCGVTVYLVGAGPGDPGLLTARGLELIAQAEVIVHDRLIPAEALALADTDAELIDVGKQAGGRSADQAEINRLLVEHGQGRMVVRLKGGDPFLFG